MKYTDNDNDKKRNKVIAIITTVVFHGLLLLCFVFMGLSYQVPPPPEYGIEVDMGGGGGGSERQTVNKEQATTPATTAPKENLSTQDVKKVQR